MATRRRTFAPRFRHVDGTWLVLAPASGTYPIGSTLEARTTDGDERTIRIAAVTRPFSSRLGHAVFLRPADTSAVQTGRCDLCGGASSELFETFDAANYAGKVCQPCRATPTDMLVFPALPIPA